MKIHHVLLTTDLSDQALRPFGPVLELAKSLNARVTILHVLQDPLTAVYGSPFSPAIALPDLTKTLESARKALHEQCQAMPLARTALQVVVNSPNPVKAIVDYAKEHKVDLIAISTHGRTGLRHMAFGSVAEGVLRKSPLPVLTFHRPTED
jgi:nucleotide-binding universal stress UspA family protein